MLRCLYFLTIRTTMLAKVCSAAVNGIEAYPVEVEVNTGYGDTIIVNNVTVSPNHGTSIPLVLSALC